MAGVLTGLPPLLDQLFAAWQRAGIHWCVLRMPASASASDGDIDLLLDPTGLKRAVRVAETHGFLRLPGRHRGVHLITYDTRTGTWLWLHCVVELAFGPYQALLGDATTELLGRRVPSWPPRLFPEDEFWVTLAHCFLDSRRVATKHRPRLAALAGESATGGAIAQGLEKFLPPGRTSEQLRLASLAGDWNTLEGLIPGVIETATRHAQPSLPRRAVLAAAKVRSRIQELRGLRGVSVALLGPDGAGKSTLAAALERTFIFPVRTMYMGLTGGTLRHVDRLRIPGVVRVGRLVVIWSRYLRAQVHLIRGRVVVFDRYIYDAEVPTPYPLGLGDRVGRWIDGHCCPAPDLILVLDAPGTSMHQRKPTYTPEMIEDWRQRFLGLRKRLSGVEVIDATRPLEEVRRAATEIVWRQYARRWDRGERTVTGSEGADSGTMAR